MKKGDKVWCLDYKEWATIFKVEKKPNPKRDDKGRFALKRASGHITFNYPGYLLQDHES